MQRKYSLISTIVYFSARLRLLSLRDPGTMASNPAPLKIKSRYFKQPTTRDEAKPHATVIINDVFNEVLKEVIPEVVRGHDFKRISPTPKPSSARSNSSPSKRPENNDGFYTPPSTPGHATGSGETQVLYKNQALIKGRPSTWHKSEVMKTIKSTRGPTIKINEPRTDAESLLGIDEPDDRVAENLPLLPNSYGRTDFQPEQPGCCSFRNRADSFCTACRKKLGNIFKFGKDNQYTMASKFSNRDYRQDFAAQMLMFKTIHMLFGYLSAILFQMTWTWEREIQQLGPPDLVKLVSDYFWITYIVLFLYIGLALAVRIYHIGQQMPFTVIIYVCFILMFSFKCYAICIGFGQLGAAIVATVTYTLCLSYGLLAILLTLNKWPEKLDLTQNERYHMDTAFVIILITSPLSWALNMLLLKITDSVFQKQIGFLGSFLEDFLPSSIIAYIIFLWEVYRTRRIVEGSVVSLPDEKQALYGAFFI